MPLNFTAAGEFLTSVVSRLFHAPILRRRTSKTLSHLFLGLLLSLCPTFPTPRSSRAQLSSTLSSLGFLVAQSSSHPCGWVWLLSQAGAH